MRRIFLGRNGAAAKKLAPVLGSLKVGFNRVHGYYIESVVTLRQAPVGIAFVRQTLLKNAERFITPELKYLKDKGALSAPSPNHSQRITSLDRTQ